jgi:two-component system sensor histidine kinase PilS (NtrC family)
VSAVRPPDRRAARAGAAPEAQSWFGGFEEAADTGFDAGETGFGLSRLASAPPPAAGANAFARIHRNFLAARAGLGVALAVALVVAALFGLRPDWWTVGIGIAYAGAAVLAWALPRMLHGVPRPSAPLRGLPWVSTIGVDLVSFLTLHGLAAGTAWNFAALLVLPLLMAGVLTTRRRALATAAIVSIALLVNAAVVGNAGGDITALLTQAGLAGIGFFVVTAVAGELAGRLAREELSARGSREMARQQAQLNQLVIEEMQDGVLVVDRRGRVRAANPAARRLLAETGLGPPAPFQLRGVGAWASLVGTAERAFVDATWPEAGRDVALEFPSGTTRTLRVRVRFTRRREDDAEAEEFCVLFLEDVRNMAARTRQEKLAAMGRMSAGIAHEIRNPLAAIAQANALMMEDAADASQRKLSLMVADNVERLKRIVDDVMAVSPGAPTDSATLDAVAQVAHICTEWAHAAGIALGADSPLQIELPDEPLGIAFDPEHLRRVLVNLLDNAHRHAQPGPGAIVVRLESRDAARVFLGIASDGAPLPPEVERHLFEPFFSTRSRGTGLGLYICRELCERHGATIDFRVRSDGAGPRNEFYLVLRGRPLQPLAQARIAANP